MQNLKASATQYGLVLLESNAMIKREDYTVVALTQVGTLAIPAASFESRGGVRLDTATPISGSGVLLVGKTYNGWLAVNASGLTAYALAVEEGFKGTQEEWLASLKAESFPLFEEQEKALNDVATHQANMQIHISEEERQSLNAKLSPDILTHEKSLTLVGTGDRGSVTYMTLAAQILPKGKLLTLTLSVPNANVPPSVDSTHELHAVLSLETGTRTYEWLATSTDTHIVTRATDLTWNFCGER